MSEQIFTTDKKIAIIGGGNIGMAIAHGLKHCGIVDPANITITRKPTDLPKANGQDGFKYSGDNVEAVKNADIVFLAVLPLTLADILDDISDAVNNDHIIVSIVTGISISEIAGRLGKDPFIVRAMPNTAIKIGESMTCLCSNEKGESAMGLIKQIFDSVGQTLVIEESLMASATVLGSCGIAFFLRSIRAAAQGGIEIGFHAEEAELISAQTAKGAAELILRNHSHPEAEIDKVTTPRGVTIAGLNEMEHNGFSSAMIKGIITSYEKTIE